MADENPYDAIVIGDGAAQSLRQSMDQAVDVQPDKESEIQRLGKVYGLPTTTVRANEEQVRRRAKVDAVDYDAIVRQTPATAAYLSNPENAKVAHDDLDTLSSIENLTRGIGERAGKLAGGFGRFAFTAVDPLASTLADWTEEAGLPSVVEFGPEGVTARARTAAEKAQPVAAAGGLVEMGEQLKLGYKPQTTWEDFKSQPLKNFFPFAIEQGLVSIPDMAAVIANLPAYVAARSGEIGQARATNDERAEATVQDFLVSAPTAVASALLERLGTKGILGLDDAARAFKEVPGAVAKAAVKEGATEGGQQIIEDVGSTAGTKKGVDPGQIAENAAAAVVGGVGFGAATRSVTGPTQVLEGVLKRASDQVAMAMDADAQAQALGEVEKFAATSKLRERDPQSFKEFVETATADGPVPDVYISAQGLAQSGVSVEELVATLPGVEGQLADAIATGGDVRIPVADFATFVAGSDLASALIPHLRTSPGGFSQTEAKAFMETQGDQLQAEVESVMATAVDKEAFAASTESVRGFFVDQLNTAARFSPDVNAAYATMMSSFYAVNAGRLGITPEEMLARYPLQVRAEGVLGGAGALDQEGDQLFHGSNAEGLDTLEPSERGALGPGVYLTPNENIAKQYGDAIYATLEPAGIFQGIKTRDSSVNPYEVWRNQTAQLVAAAESPEQSAEVQALAEKMQPGDGYPFFKRLAQIIGSEQGAQDLFRAAGFTGISGTADGPEVVVFDPVTVDALNQRTRGQFTPANSTITLLKNADLSTFLHESGHFYLETLADMAAQPDAPAEVQADMDAVLKWFGVEDLATWQGMTLDQQRENHEQFARGFEAYLFEGKAPSSGLRAVFQRFSAWLRNIYREISRLKVDLSDDVRGVFDRMLASAEAIQQQELATRLGPMFQTAEEAGMSEAEWENYRAEATEAMAEAMGDMQTRSLRDMKWLSNAKDKAIRRLQREAADQRKAVKAEVTAEVMAEPVNRARTFLRRGIGADGEQVEGPHKLSLPAMRDMFSGVPEELQDWQGLGYGRYGMLAEEGLLPDQVAADYGFASGEALVEALLNAEPVAEKIQGMTDQRMLERFGDLADDDAIERAADQALHNDARLRFVATEANALAKATGRPRILAKAAKDYALGMIGRLKVKEVKPNRFRAAETRAAIAADQARKKGDLITATVEKRNQLINAHAVRAAQDSLGEMEKALIVFRRIVAGKDETLARNRDMDLINAARSILSAYGIGRAKNNPTGYVETIKRLDPVLYGDLEPFLINAQTNAKDWREITVDEFNALRDTINQLWFLSKRNRQMEIDGELVDRKAVADTLSARLDELGVPDTAPGSTQAVTQGERALRSLSGLRAATRRVESWTRNMDGADTGPFRKYIWNTISEPADAYRAERNVYIEKFLRIVEAVEGGLKPFKLAAPELGYTFSGKSELLHAILHTGNESNKRKLLLGRRWATEGADGVLDTSRWDAFVARMQAEGRLTKSDYDFAQATWDLLEETKEGAQKAHRTVFGRYFEEVTAQAFTTPWGDYRGGYVPALTDTFLVQDAAQRAEQEAVTESDSNMFPSPAKGFTKSRVDYNRELALDLRLIPQHIDKVLKFTYFAPPTREAVRLLKDKGFSARLNAYDPVAQTDLLLPWLNRAARQIVETPIKGEAGRAASRFASALRQRAGLGIMFANITNALQQVTGFSVSAVRVKPRLLAGAMWEYMQDPGGVAERIRGNSSFMATRTDSSSYEMRQTLDDLLLNPNKFQQSQEFFKRHGYFLQTAFQNVVDHVTWLGAYNQATEQGASDREAIRTANSVVRETQGSLNAEDVSRFETGSAFWRLFTQFQGFFNNQANLLGTEFNLAIRDMGLRKGAGRMLYVYMLGFMAPAVLSESIVTLMRGGIDDEDDDGYLDDILAKFWGSQGRFALAMVPVAGPIAAAVFNAANDKPYDDRITTPAITTIENASRAPAEVYKAMAEDGDQSKALKDTLSLMTLLTGIPFNAAARPLGYLADVNEGDVEPTNVVDFGRGLATGAASPDSRE